MLESGSHRSELSQGRAHTMNTSFSEKFFERSKRVSPGGVHSPVRAFKGVGGVPRFIEKAQGVCLTDVDGNSYTDFCLSWGPLILGHQDPEVLAAVEQALHKGWTYGTVEPLSLELAELITSSLPWVEKIRFVNSGTEAVMAALRVARAATGRDLILKFDGCYHGHCDSMLVRAGSGLAEMAAPDSAGVSRAVAGESLVVSLNHLAALDQIFAQRGKEIAAVIVEPVPANNGLLTQKPEFFEKLSQLTKSHGVLLIFDEVITGFRVGFGGMAERTGIRPDLVTYGKIIGGGFPVGAYGGRADLMDLVAPQGPVYQAGTLSANPIAMTAGLATLKKLKREMPYQKLEEKTERMSCAIEKAVLRQTDLKFHIQRNASIFWPVFGSEEVREISQIPAIQKEMYARVFHSLLDQGIYLAPSGFEVSFLSTAHEDQHLDSLVQAFQGVFS